MKNYMMIGSYEIEWREKESKFRVYYCNSLIFECFELDLVGERINEHIKKQILKSKICSQCDPDKYVIYGYCPVCGKKGLKPLSSALYEQMITQEQWENMPAYLKSEVR